MAKLTKTTSIGPVQAALIRLAAAEITYDDKPIQDAIGNQVNKLRSIYEEEEKYKSIPFNPSNYLADAQSVLARVQDQNFKQTALSSFQQIVQEASQAIQTKNPQSDDLVQEKIDALLQKTMDFGKGNNLGNWSSIRDFYKLCDKLSTHVTMLLSEDAGTERKVAEYQSSLNNEHTKVSQQVADLKAKIQQLVGVSLPEGINVNIQIKSDPSTDEYGSPVIYPANFSIELDFGFQDTLPPQMTLFPREDGNYEVDDVLDFGDTDFFAGQQDMQFYFALVNFFRTGKLPTEEPVKFLRLYRGMSNEEFMLWLGGQIIPKGKFFTSQKTAALAQDVSGQFPELFSFKVRSDAVTQTSENIYQTIKDCRMDNNKRITPV